MQLSLLYKNSVNQTSNIFQNQFSDLPVEEVDIDNNSENNEVDITNDDVADASYVS